MSTLTSRGPAPGFRPPDLIRVGPPEHGVVRHAERLHRMIEAMSGPASGSAVGSAVPYVHFTDRVFGSSPAGAAENYSTLARGHRSTGLAVVLHDVPQPSDGSNFEARRACYRRVVERSVGVVVSSNHEKRLLDLFVTPCDPVVIPLPIDVSNPVAYRPPTAPTVGMLGFLYPGKGHLEVVRAMPDGAQFVALGRPSPGHDDLVDELTELGRPVRVTGWLDDAAMREELADIAVPVAHHRHVSASASITSWIEAGRRPLVVRNAYSEEIAERSPGTVTLYDEADLTAAVERALANPDSTRVSSDRLPFPSPSDAARAHLDAFARFFA